MATGLTVCQDIRSRPLCTCVLRPCLRLRLSSGKQEGAKESRQCGRVCDRTFIGRLGCRARPAGGGWEPWPFGGAACAAGQAIGRQTFRKAGFCDRCARRERESASGCLARSFTEEVLYSLSAFCSLSVTRMRSPRLFRRGSPNGEPSEVSSALPEQRNEAGILFRESSTHSMSRRLSLARVSVADAIERAFCAV